MVTTDATPTPAPAPTAGETDDRSDWDAAQALLDAYPSKYGSLNWIASRPLIAGLNDRLSRVTGGLVIELRKAWVKQQNPNKIEPVVEQPSATSWVVIGDTGEQDGSQYVVCRALSDFCRTGGPAGERAKPGFMVMMSDIIYPAGDVEDYKYAVYHPYKLAPLPGRKPAGLNVDDFTITQPIYALPGNHDWYDGLSGFMYHFARQEPLPHKDYKHTWNPVYWVFRVLWRRARPASNAMKVARRERPLNPAPQPGPYYTIQTGHIRLVCIDTGIDGHIDDDQYDWLKGVSAKPGAKILLTGKPLVVDRQIHDTTVPGHPGWSVWNLVNDPTNQYVATIGGDIHNFQMYPRNRKLPTYFRKGADVVPENGRPDPGEAKNTPFVHMVAGGGGAFMHAAHVHHTVAQYEIEPGLLTSDGNEMYPSPPKMTFPNTAQSLRFYAARLAGGVDRAMTNLVVMILVLGAGACVDQLSPWPADPVLVTLAAGVALLLLAAVIRVFAHRKERTEPLPRFVVTWLGSPGVGLLVAGLTYRLIPQHAGRYLALAAGLTALLSFIAAWARQTRWWARRVDTSDSARPVRFWTGLALLTLALGSAQVYFLATPPVSRWTIAPAALLFVVGAVGWTIGRERWRRWQTIGSVGIPVLQVLITLAVVWQVAWGFDLQALYGSALLGGLLGVIVVTAATAGLILLVSLGVAVGVRCSGKDWLHAWGKSARVTWIFWNLFLIAATVGWAALCFASPGRNWLIDRPALGLPGAVVAVVSVLFGVDWLHRHLPNRYVWVVLPCALAGIAGAWLGQGFWAVRVIVAAIVIIFGVLVGATAVHFCFLGAYRLRSNSQFREILAAEADADDRLLTSVMPDKDIVKVFRRRARNCPETGDIANFKRLQFWVRMTAPGLSQPGGPVQRLVSELFSSDKPKFYKHFLSFISEGKNPNNGAGVLRITMHEIYGNQTATPRPVATVRWKPDPTNPRHLIISGWLRSVADPD